MGFLNDYPEREGYRLTEEGEDLYNDWRINYVVSCYCPYLERVETIKSGTKIYCKFVEEIGDDMARDNVVNKSINPIYESFKQTYSTEANINSKGEVNMNNTNRKTVTVNLIDRDTSLDEKHALVANFGSFTTSKSPEALIRSIIMEPKNEVAKLIEQHNELRTKQINKEILQRTGNKVNLEPVEESDLYWEIL